MFYGVRRREHCDLREVMSATSLNDYELVQQWLRVTRQACQLVVKFYLHTATTDGISWIIG